MRVHMAHEIFVGRGDGVGGRGMHGESLKGLLFVTARSEATKPSADRHASLAMTQFVTARSEATKQSWINNRNEYLHGV
jgi:hypothetical protein